MNRRTSAWAAAHDPAGSRRGKKALSLLLSLVLCLTLLPATALAADNYGFYINGKPVSEGNISDFITAGSIAYDNGVLTLEDATIEGSGTAQTILHCNKAVKTIRLKGKNVITGAAPSNIRDLAAIYTANGSLTIEGERRSDSLEITMPAVAGNNNISVKGIYAQGWPITIRNCTLDVVCAGDTANNGTANAVYAYSSKITIENATVNAVIGKERDGNTTALYGGTAIYADGGTLSITDSDVTAGAYSSRTTGAYKYTALEGKTINLMDCGLTLNAEAEPGANAARALFTGDRSSSITLTNCTGTLSGSDYGIHITGSAVPLTIDVGNLTITGGKNAISTTGSTPAFTGVTVKSGEGADTAQEVDLTTTIDKFWEAKYLEAKQPVTSVEINDTNFPDPSFREVVSTFDTDRNGSLSAEELGTVKSIECDRKGIADLTGIAYFTALEELNCTGNRLTELDVSRNTALKKLYCGKNQLTSLNVNDNAALEKLICFKNRLAALEISNNTALTYLDCSNNQLTSLNVETNSLNTLYADNNVYEIEAADNGSFNLSTLSGFDVSKASDWKGGTVSGNTLTVDKDAALVTYTYSLGREVDGESTVAFALMVKCAGTDIAIDEDHFPDAAFRAYLSDPDSNIDRNQDGKLSAGEVALVREIDVYDESDIKSLEGIEYFTALTYLDCHGCNLTSLDLSKNIELTDLSADDNTYEIQPDADGTFDLFTLPGKFDASKASEWNGGTVENGILTVNKDAEEVTYDYDCGNNQKVNFTLKIAKKYTVTAYDLYGSRPGFTPGEIYNGSYAAGDTVNLPIGTREGYTFGGLTCKEIAEKDLTIGSDMGEPIVSFIMPATNVTITVNWAKNSSSGGSGSSGSTTYPVTATGKTENGSVTVSPKNASRGSTVTVTVTPDKGYVLETLTALDKDGKELKLTDKGSGKYTFTMPAGSVTVKATFMDDNTMLNFFVDVKAGDFFYDAVLWAAQKGITTGTDAVHFSPNESCTRAQIVTFLWRAAGSPVVNYAMNMSDVPEDAYYAEAVRWALSEGITSGVGDGRFDPDGTCTREQAVTLLYRVSGSPAVSGGSAFGDVAADGYYANAVAWAEKNGVTGGIGGGLFGTGGDCTRGQIVTFLYRAYQGK